jgi:hypothetical protein
VKPRRPVDRDPVSAGRPALPVPGRAGRPPRGDDPTIAQLLAEELVTEMVRRQIDVVGLLELETDVIEAVRGIAGDLGSPGAVPAEALAATLIDQAFRVVEGEWRDQRRVCGTDECPCCAMEEADARRKQGLGRPPGVPSMACRGGTDLGARLDGDDRGDAPDDDRSVS